MKSTVPLPSPIDRLHGACHRWLGDEYDLDAIDVVVAAAAVERMTGDPLWVLVVSGPGAAKTETVQLRPTPWTAAKRLPSGAKRSDWIVPPNGRLRSSAPSARFRTATCSPGAATIHVG